MKANELRIGNYIFIIDEDGNKEPLQVDLNDICDIESSIDKETHEPIPLIEQWLLDFGFEKVQHILGVSGFKSYGYEKGIISVYLIKDGFEIEYYAINEYFNLAKTFKHVHQLQNLYFALTGNELNK